MDRPLHERGYSVRAHSSDRKAAHESLCADGDPAENKDLTPGTAFFAQDGVDHERGYGEALWMIKRERNRMRLLSTTRDVKAQPREAFGSCWARPRVWEQYADAHRGVCLVFSRDAFVAALTQRFGDGIEFEEVEYTPQGIAEWQIAGAKQVCDAINVELKRIVWWNGRPITVRARASDS